MQIHQSSFINHHLSIIIHQSSLKKGSPMKNFQYFRPTTAEAAVGLLENRWGNTELLAGGTDLLDLQKEYIAQPARVVSLGGVGGMSAINVTNQAATIGASVKLADIAANAQLRTIFPALTSAAGEIAGPQIRNMGTLGGSLCQRNRCWYFRDEHSHCLLKGGQRCFALDGENKYHAIFTQGHRCVIVHPSTLAPVLIALGASAEILGPKGRRTTDLAKLFRAPSGPGEREHNLASNEVLMSVTIPRSGLNNAHYEVRQKQSSDWPLVQAVVAFNGGRDGQNATNVKIVLGHVAPTPHLAEAAGTELNNHAVTDARATAVGRTAAQGSKPLSQNAYKVRLVEVAVKRAILLAAGMKPYWE
jgi:xanthine dehydrogenase YagS FAD-binding subunit